MWTMLAFVDLRRSPLNHADTGPRTIDTPKAEKSFVQIGLLITSLTSVSGVKAGYSRFE